MDAFIARFGRKRDREWTLHTGDSIRFAGIAANGQPMVVARASDSRWNGLPPEITLQILHALDLATYTRMLEVSHDFHHLISEVDPVPEHFMSQIDLQDFFREVKWGARKTLLGREAAYFHTLKNPNWRQDLLAALARPNVQFVKLDIQSGMHIASQFSPLLKEMEQAVARRSTRASCEFVWEYEPDEVEMFEFKGDELNQLRTTLQGLEHLKIVSAEVLNEDWLSLTQWMPFLRNLSLKAKEPIDPAKVCTQFQMLKSMPRLCIEDWGYQGERATRYLAVFKTLGIKHVRLCSPSMDALAAWKDYGLETLEIVTYCDRGQLGGVAKLLEGKSPCKSFILTSQCDHDEYFITDLAALTPVIEDVQGMQRLEIRAINTAREDHFVLNVLKNPGILKARLPYPEGYQWVVNAAMRREPQRDIRNKSDSIRLMPKCEETLALIDARNKTR